jgi:serine/threonine protein kinase
MLAGCPPFEGGSLLALLEQHRDHPVMPPSIKIGKALEAIVTRCLAKDPDERYGDARESGLRSSSERHCLTHLHQTIEL